MQIEFLTIMLSNKIAVHPIQMRQQPFLKVLLNCRLSIRINISTRLLQLYKRDLSQAIISHTQSEMDEI